MKGKYFERGLRQGTPVPDWSGVKKITSPTDPEKTGYKTQKSIELYSRIIKASSILETWFWTRFAEVNMRCIRVVGPSIDVEEKARELVVDRLRKEVYRVGFLEGVQDLREMPLYQLRRTLPSEQTPMHPEGRRTSRRVLLQRQQWTVCKGVCGARRLDIDLFEIDHIRPRSKGGTDTDENLQLSLFYLQPEEGIEGDGPILGTDGGRLPRPTREKAFRFVRRI